MSGVTPVNFQLAIEKTVIEAIKAKINLHTIAEILHHEAEIQARLARIVQQVQGGDTWP